MFLNHYILIATLHRRVTIIVLLMCHKFKFLSTFLTSKKRGHLWYGSLLSIL